MSGNATQSVAQGNVLVLSGDSYKAVQSIFRKRGWNVLTETVSQPVVDLVVFTGGTDVDPALYGEERHPMTQSSDIFRDQFELASYKMYVRCGIPMVGICRGGQLLNVLNGGKMIQHLGKTVSGDVEMWDTVGIGYRTVRVDHHQGMVRRGNAVDGQMTHYPIPGEPDMGVSVDYVIWYPETKSLCFQPHPEWGHQGTEDYFFQLIGRYVHNAVG